MFNPKELSIKEALDLVPVSIYIVTLSILWLLLVFMLGLVYLNINPKTPVNGNSPSEKNVVYQSKAIDSSLNSQLDWVINVSGAVNKPGVVTVRPNSLVADAIVVAGGFSQDVDSKYIHSKLNLAQPLENHQHLWIPSRNEVASVSTSNGTSINKISINSASNSELETLKGIGEVRASLLIEGRPYKQISDLVSKEILSQTIFDEIKNQLIL